MISRSALRDALKSVGISTKDLTKLVIDPHEVTITRLVRDNEGKARLTHPHHELVTTTDVINIGEQGEDGA